MLTGTGVALGTPTYMSPEQAAGSRDLDGRSDLYSLACVLYEMLVGQPPFTGPTVESIVQQHLTVAPTPVTRVRPAVPVDVARVISRALEKTPADRYATTAQFVEALARGRSPAPASAEAVAPAQHHGRPGAAVSQRHRGPWWAWAAAALGLVVGTLGVWRLRASPAGSEAPQSVAAAAGQSSVAVLPFDNLGGRPEDLYLSEGITEEIIGQLAQVGGLKVISRTSVVALKGSGLTLPQIADTLGVRHILEGSVRRAGTRIRVAAQLIDARTDVHLWAESYERELTDVFSVQEEIARQVSAALVTTVGELRGAGPRSRTRDPGAYGAYLRGKYLLHRRTPDAMRGARIDFEQAIALDSGFAPAWGGLAAALGLPVTYGYGDVDPYVAYGRAVAAATRGIALDSGLADAYAARAYVLTKAMFPANVVHADIRRALKLSPNSADVHGWYAHYLSREGDYGRAIEEADRAIALDPLAPGRRLGMAYDALGARRYDLASREAQGAAALEPGLTLARALGGLADLLSGRPERCAPSGDLVPYVGVAAACLDAAGRHAEAAALVDSLRVSLGRGTTTTDYSASVPLGELAVYYAWIGDARQSLSWLEEAFNLSPQAVDYRIIASGVFDRVRSDPAFRAGYARIRERVRARTEVEIQRAHPAPRRVLGPDPQ
jgi:serine/threonine-protein kinase